MKAAYVVTSRVRALAKENGKRLGAGFLNALDSHIQDIVDKACTVHNGGKKTLDATVAAYVIGSK